jgi:hypothetical protein
VLRIPLSVLGSDPINQSGSGEGPGHSQDDRPSHQAIFGSSGLDWSNLVTSRAVFHPCIRPAPMDYSGLLGEGSIPVPLPPPYTRVIQFFHR